MMYEKKRGDVVVIFRANGEMETDFDDAHEEDFTVGGYFVMSEQDPIFRSLLTAVMFHPDDPESKAIRERLFSIAQEKYAPPGTVPKGLPN